MPTRLLEQCLITADAELKYANSIHAVDLLVRDEDIRRLRFSKCVLEGDLVELKDLLEQETGRSEALEKLVNDTLLRAEDAEAKLQDACAKTQAQDQETAVLRAERAELQNITRDTSTAVAEKLALTRELSMLKPELEHLKAQVLMTESLVSEKLSLQRQLTEIQCELESAKRETRRAMAKRRNTGVEIAQEEQMEELKRQLVKEKRARQRAEDSLDDRTEDVDIKQIRKELAKEKQARQKAEEELEELSNATQIEDVRKDLLKEKKAREKLQSKLDIATAELDLERKQTQETSQDVRDLEQTAARERALQTQVATLTKQLSEAEVKSAETAAKQLVSPSSSPKRLLEEEKRGRFAAETALKTALADFEAQKSSLEDKLDQFRTKLKSSKTALKAAEADSSHEQLPLPVVRIKAIEPRAVAPKVVHRRNLAQVGANETTLGTPGHGIVGKRARKPVTANVGDKSTFSITPFLNRTVSVGEEDEAIEGAEEDNDHGTSPSASARPALTEQSASEANARKLNTAKTLLSLDEVVENAEKASALPSEATVYETVRLPPVVVPTKDGSEPEKKTVGKRKMRKSIHDFADFDAEPEVRKKQKPLGGGLGKTLFDDIGTTGPSLKLFSGKSLFGGRSLGFGAKKTGPYGSVGTNAGSAIEAGGATTFSPRKRNRRNMDDILRG